MKPRDAFLISHEIYATARELVDDRLSTTRMETSSKFVWRPDLHPRLVEYVADFALAGERALEGRRLVPSRRLARGAGPESTRVRQPAALRASRLILFRMYYLGGAEYHAARRMLGISERTWADWADEIHDLVGRELMRAGMFPPLRYFKEMSRPRKTRGKPGRSH